MRLKPEGVALRALDAAVAPAVAAQGHILVVAAYLHLVAVGDDVAVTIDAGIHYGLAAAGACALYLVDGVGQLKQAPGAFKQVCLEVGAQAVANHVDAIVVDDARQLVDLLGA